jgi:hypothetical protein
MTTTTTFATRQALGLPVIVARFGQVMDRSLEQPKPVFLGWRLDGNPLPLEP